MTKDLPNPQEISSDIKFFKVLIFGAVAANCLNVAVFSRLWFTPTPKEIISCEKEIEEQLLEAILGGNFATQVFDLH